MMETEDVSYGVYEWPRIAAEQNETRNCQYGGLVRGLPGQLARRLCSDRGVWYPTSYSECATFTLSLLANTSEVIFLACIYIYNIQTSDNCDRIWKNGLVGEKYNFIFCSFILS